MKVLVLKNDALVPIEISGAYYARMRGLCIKLLESLPDPKASIVKIDEGKEQLTLEEYTIQSLMMFLGEVEGISQADKEKYMEEVDVPTDSSEN